MKVFLLVFLLVAVSASFKQTGLDGLLEELEQASELGSLKQNESEERTGRVISDEILEELVQAAEFESLEQHESQSEQQVGFFFNKRRRRNERRRRNQRRLHRRGRFAKGQ